MACGPTSLWMFLSFHTHSGLLLPEEDQPPEEGRPGNKSVITRLKEIPPSQGGYDPDCQLNPACTSPPVLVQVARSFGVAVNDHENWTVDDLRKSLLAGKPVLVSHRLEFDPERAAHYFVVVGLVDDTVYYNDPYTYSEAEGKKKQGHLDDFELTWDTDIDKGKDPTKPEGWNGWRMVAAQ